MPEPERDRAASTRDAPQRRARYIEGFLVTGEPVMGDRLATGVLADASIGRAEAAL